MAIAEQMLAARFNTGTHSIVDHYTYVLAGDGCMMEGVASEAASLAGHLKLNKLIVFYDSNKITIEGSTTMAFTEDVGARFRSYGWETISVDAYDPQGIVAAVAEAQKQTDRPTLIEAVSTIGKGAPTMAGSHKVHGSPLGEKEIEGLRKSAGIPQEEEFFVDPEAIKFFASRLMEMNKKYKEWQEDFEAWSSENPALKKEWDNFFAKTATLVNGVSLPEFKLGEKVATRKASGIVLNAFAEVLENLVGGSADLAPSNNTMIESSASFSSENRIGRNIHFGVREHAMGGIMNGIVLHGGLKIYAGTFLVFSDYMRPAIRLAALMKIPSIFVFTHDSIFVGEDGPTHQPVEHIEALRVIPNLNVIRPADAEETSVAWSIALSSIENPTALILTRQGLPVYEKEDPAWTENMHRGAYIVRKGSNNPDVTLVATGSEVTMALEAANSLPGKSIRVVSMPSRTTFMEQDAAYREELIPKGSTVIAVEAGVPWGWASVTGSVDSVFSIRRFGESGPAMKVAAALRFTSIDLKDLIISRTEE